MNRITTFVHIALISIFFVGILESMQHVIPNDVASEARIDASILCPICLEQCKLGEEDLSVLECNHVLHLVCFLELMEHRRQHICPLCRSMNNIMRLLPRLLPASPVASVLPANAPEIQDKIHHAWSHGWGSC